MPRVVLDTNVLLDWLVFRDPAVATLVGAIACGRLQWVATPAMRTEFERVLAYPQVARFSPDAAVAARCWELHARLHDAAPAAAPMRCGDPEDQMFIDLAVAARARWLLSKDRELLKLARRASAFGVAVLPPARWPGP